MKTYIIDIETAPLPKESIARFAPQFKADSRLKDPVKIAEDIRSKEEKFISSAALNPLIGQICAIGIWETSQPEPALYYDIPEKDIIQKFVDIVGTDNLSRVRMVTFNGMHFDIPFICRRGLLYGLDLFPTFFRIDGGFKILDKAPVFIDLAAIWDCRRKDYVSLNELSIFMGVGSKSADGEFFHEMLKNDKKAAADYLKNDLLLTKKIAEKWGLIK
jgi:hypothetical protein